jgi:hypothetical protein
VLASVSGWSGTPEGTDRPTAVWWALSAAAVGVSLSVPEWMGNIRVTPWRAAVILTGFLEAIVIFRGAVVERGRG